MKNTNKYFKEFLNAKGGTFNGFKLDPEFHASYSKENAIYTTRSDDIAEVHTPFGVYDVNADGIWCYFLNDHPTKKVVFNKSVYFI